MPVYFKFRGERSFRNLQNVLTPCTVQRVKTAIYEQAGISDSATDLALDDASTSAPLQASILMIPESTVRLVVRRVPFKQDVETTTPLVSLDVPNLLEAEEEDLAIDRIVELHGVDSMGLSSSSDLGGKRSVRLKPREGYDRADGEVDEDTLEAVEPPPLNYTCFRCGMTGGKPESHWIWECPTNDDPEHTKKVRVAKGVPRQFLQKVASIEEGQEMSAGGVTFTIPGHDGHYIIAHQDATVEEKKRRLGDTMREKLDTAFSAGARHVEGSLTCPLCNQMFRQAMLSPCCGASFCSDCIIDRLTHSSLENSVCPSCGEEVLAHQLVTNEDIRQQVEQVSKSSKAAAIASQKEKEQEAIELERQQVAGSQNRRALKNEGGTTPLLALPPSGKTTEETAPLKSGGNGGRDRDRHRSRRSVGAPVSWHPLGFGPRLTPEQFHTWQRSLRGVEIAETVKGQFEEWQRQTKAATIVPDGAQQNEAAAAKAQPASVSSGDAASVAFDGSLGRPFASANSSQTLAPAASWPVTSPFDVPSSASAVPAAPATSAAVATPSPAAAAPVVAAPAASSAPAPAPALAAAAAAAAGPGRSPGSAIHPSSSSAASELPMLHSKEAFEAWQQKLREEAAAKKGASSRREARSRSPRRR